MRLSMGRMVLLGIIIATGSVYASDNHSNKTFLMSRAPGVNLAMEYTTWHDHVYNGKHNRCVSCCQSPCARTCVRRSCDPCGPGRINAHFQVTGFYQDSTNHHEIGKYFGIGNGK